MLLEDDIGGYQSQITSLEGRLEEEEDSFKEAHDEASKWKAGYAKVQSKLQDKPTSVTQTNKQLQVLGDNIFDCCVNDPWC